MNVPPAPEPNEAAAGPKPGGPPQGGPSQGGSSQGGLPPGGPPAGAPPGTGRATPPPPGRTRGAFLADLHALPGRVSVRLRLTLLYGLLFFLAGGMLLIVTYLLVADILSNIDVGVYGVATSEQLEHLRQEFIQQTMRQLIGRSLLALAGVGVIALVLGYFVADRALAPLQKMTTTARQLSESTLHERIALEGPEDEIKELADTFDAMLERLGQAFDSQRRFVANASHELRTPLAINRTLLEVALGDPEASEDLKAVGRTLLATNARHERLIEGLLLLARSERELTSWSPADLAEVAAKVLETLGKRTDGPEVTVHTELTEGRAMGDPVLLEHLVSNLVDNAIKHNVENGEVFVRTGVLDGFAACQVENTGPVVPAYEVDRLFEPFRRLHTDRIESAKGAGLGLSIVRSVVRAHRGTVYATPRPGGGLIVTARVPLAL
ncbi:sensor histidine kinase [Actinomadura alba]|uniref:histidine kinase n=1 Tax=Actinomadura alba TaxID=406431 RepID=A0ABR7LKW1_9ACTN|nr:HAMP domain-containing sensor histidine kinase [Actinomadura alba]MBC6465013.1 HAMP domain-containing histidine kinase [Actinomadura alba]